MHMSAILASGVDTVFRAAEQWLMPEEPMPPFKIRNDFDRRRQVSTKIQMTYSDRVGVVVITKDVGEHPIPYVVGREMTVAKFLHKMREQALNHVRGSDALFLMVDNVLCSPSTSLGNLYDAKHDSDGFLYVTLSKESTFG